MPKRIQRKRTKGWRMPEGAVYVGRGSQWGNPFKVGIDGTAKECVEKYSKMLMPYTHQSNNGMDDFLLSQANMHWIEQLKGKDLACWCKESEQCHADWLLFIAN